MLDIQYVREHIDEIRQNCENRGLTIDIRLLLDLDERRREKLKLVEALRAQRRQGSKNKPSQKQIERMRELGEDVKREETELETIEATWTELMQKLPNLTHESTPVGADETGNRVIRQWGKIPNFSFEPKEHWELGETLGIIDKESAAPVSGARFAYIKGDLALMHFALVQFTMHTLTQRSILEKIAQNSFLNVQTTPFIPVLPPVMIRPDVMQKMGRLEPRDERYYIQSDDIYLVGSAEHTLGPMHMDEIFTREQLPKRYIGFSTAFRREAGAYGKDTKGIFRVHQFDKLEMESFTTADDSLAEQDFLIAIQEYLMQQLNIPYQVVQKCTGDMGLPDYREFDIEAWLPGQRKYRETHTADHMSDFQARRLGIKVKTNQGTEFVHMNDATAIALSRTPVAIIENYQQSDGSILVPEVLRPYVGKDKIEHI